MKSKEIQKHIDRVVGTEGTLRIPSWWMHKILSDLVKYCEDNEGASVTIKEYIESQLNLVGKTIEDLDTRLENIESHELFEIVSELPSEPKGNTIYLIPSQNGEGNNVLTEWVYINGTWEQFGEFNANVDLSEYAKKEALDELSEEIVKKQDALVSGENIKTINGESIIGSGNIEVAGQDIFVAIYGKTKYEEVVAAYNRHQHVMCFYINNLYSLFNLAPNNDAYFTGINEDYSYRVICRRDSVWYATITQLEKSTNKVTSLSSASTDTQYPSAKAVYDALPTLETLPNGNLKVTIDGVSKDFMPATPSGDPMHYAYVEAGAEYNDTGADIVRTGMYGDSIVWKSGYWYLNEIGDISNEEIRLMYKLWVKFPMPFSYSYKENIRTIFPFNGRSILTGCTNVLANKTIEIVPSCHGDNNISNNISSWFYEAQNLRRCDILFDNVNNYSNAFVKCFKLERVNIKRLNKNISLADSSLLKNESILYMVANSNATSATTITLHADAYARAMADTEITAALEAHPNVSLASA